MYSWIEAGLAHGAAGAVRWLSSDFVFPLGSMTGAISVALDGTGSVRINEEFHL